MRCSCGTGANWSLTHFPAPALARHLSSRIPQLWDIRGSPMTMQSAAAERGRSLCLTRSKTQCAHRASPRPSIVSDKYSTASPRPGEFMSCCHPSVAPITRMEPVRLRVYRAGLALESYRSALVEARYVRARVKHPSRTKARPPRRARRGRPEVAPVPSV